MLPEPIAAQPPSPRIAAESFFRGSLHGWGRRDLAQWLVCHYGACVRRIENDQAVESTPRVVIALPDSRRWPVEEKRAIDDARIERLVRSARRDALRMLYDLGDPEVANGIARLAIARGLVEKGERGWVPLDGRRLKLVDRIASLLIADYLNAPLEYRNVIVCQGCGSVSRGGQEVHAEGCQPRRCESGLHEIEPAPPTLRSGSMTG